MSWGKEGSLAELDLYDLQKWGPEQGRRLSRWSAVELEIRLGGLVLEALRER